MLEDFKRIQSEPIIKALNLSAIVFIGMYIVTLGTVYFILNDNYLRLLALVVSILVASYCGYLKWSNEKLKTEKVE